MLKKENDKTIAVSYPALRPELGFNYEFSDECYGRIESNGYVWVGCKESLSEQEKKDLLEMKQPRILLFDRGIELYWAYFTEISDDIPEEYNLQEIYKPCKKAYHSWFKVYRLKPTDIDTLVKSIVEPSKERLYQVIASGNDSFKINYTDTLPPTEELSLQELIITAAESDSAILTKIESHNYSIDCLSENEIQFMYSNHIRTLNKEFDEAIFIAVENLKVKSRLKAYISSY